MLINNQKIPRYLSNKVKQTLPLLYEDKSCVVTPAKAQSEPGKTLIKYTIYVCFLLYE